MLKAIAFYGAILAIAISMLSAMRTASEIVLMLTPLAFHVEFPPSTENYSIVTIINSNDSSHPFFKYDESPIASDDDSSIDIPRHHLPAGNYTIEAGLLRWVDNKPTPVAWSDSLSFDEE